MTDKKHPLTDELCEQIAITVQLRRFPSVGDIGRPTFHHCDMRCAYDRGAADKNYQAQQWLKQNAWKYLKQKDYSEEYTIDESKLCDDFQKAMWFDP